MDDDPSPLARSGRVAARVVYALLLAHALFVVLTAEWPGTAVLIFLFAVWYGLRASETLRRVRVQLFERPA